MTRRKGAEAPPLPALATAPSTPSPGLPTVFRLVALRLTLVALLTTAAAAQPARPAPDRLQATAMAEAEAALGAGETQLAESRFRRALLEGWLVLGALDAAEDRLEAAADSFRRAAASAAETRRAQASLAAVHLRRGEPGAAVDLLRRLAAGYPDDVALRKLLAQALIAAGEIGEAVQELEEAYAASGDPEIGFSLGTGYLRLDQPERADEVFAEVATARPGAATWTLIGRTLRDHEHPRRARRALERALELDPAARRASFYLGTVELLLLGGDGYAPAGELFRRELATYPDDPIARFYYGMVLTEQRSFEQALPHLETAAGSPAMRLDALRYLGRCQLALGRVEEATATLEEALALAAAPGTRPRQRQTVHFHLGQALRRQGREDAAAEHLAASRRELADVVEGYRDDLAALVREAAGGTAGGGLGSDASDGSGSSDGSDGTGAPLAVPELDGLGLAVRREVRERVETALARTYFNLGVGHLRGGRFERALTPLTAAERLRPDFPELQRSLGAARFNAGRFAAAAEALERALTAAPDDRELRRMLALAQLNGGRPDRAAELLADDPGRRSDRSLQFAYGLALVRSGGAAEAEEAFGRLLSEHADWPELHVVLGQAHAQQGDFPAAVSALERALALRPDVPEANLTLGDLYMRRGELDAAEEALRAELEHRPGDADARYRLAVVLDLNRRPDEATRELLALLDARPDHADGRYLLGKIRLAQGAAEEASTHLEAAAALAPEDANVRYQLAQAYQRSGRPEQAAEQLAAYRELKRREAGP